MANHETGVSPNTSSQASKPSPETSVFSIYKMTKGCTMLKAKRHGTPQFKKFVLSRDLSHLLWGSPRKQEEKSVLISQMTQLLKGQVSKGFASCPVPQKESISFSLIYKIGRSFHSVDIICLDKQQYDIWTVGIQALIDGFNDKKSIDHLYEKGGLNDDTDGKPMQGTDEIPMSMIGSGGKPYNEDACDLYMWGDGTTGMLGHGENGEENVPRSVEALLSKDIWKVACGVAHTISLTSDGEVFSWGSGLGGKLGQGHLRDRSSPLRVAALKDKKVTSIACHEFHSAAVCGLGDLFTWGQGGPRLGYMSEKRKEILPRLVEGLQEHRVTEVACGLSHTLVCTRNGQCYAFGDNTYGQLGIPGIASSYDPVRSQELESFHISYIACGSNHSAALSDRGLVWLWGANHSGQTGLENVDISSKPNLLSLSVELRNHSIIDVSCGTKHTVLLSKKGKLFGIGDNTENQLGINQRGRTEEPILKVSVPSRIHLSAHSRASKPIQVSCGAFHTAVLTESGELFTWGKGKAGRLGHGDIRDRPLPCEVDMDGKRVRAVACGSTHTACLVTRAWVSDDLIKNCMACKTKFSLVNRKHHCRKCGGVFCASCTSKRTPVPTLPGYPGTSLRRVCDKCYSLLLDDT